MSSCAGNRQCSQNNRTSRNRQSDASNSTLAQRENRPFLGPPPIARVACYWISDGSSATCDTLFWIASR